LYDYCAYAAAGFIFLIFAAMIASTVVRLLGIAAAGVDDVVSWMTAAAAFLAMAHTFRRGDFVRMTLVIEAASPKYRRAMEIIAITGGLVGTAYAARWVVESVPKLKAGVDAYGPMGWRYVQSRYATYPWKSSIDRLDTAEKLHLVELIRRARKVR
jgi:hypothetical protein